MADGEGAAPDMGGETAPMAPAPFMSDTMVVLSVILLIVGGGIGFLVFAWYQNRDNFVRTPKKLSKKKQLKQRQKESRFTSGE